MKFYNCVKAVFTFLSHLFFPVRVHNSDIIPKEGKLIVCANHLSLMDAFFIMIAVDRPISFLAKDVYASNFILKPFFKMAHAISINADIADISAIKQCFKVLKSGNVLGIFPEGTRIRKGVTAEGKGGTIMMAHRTGAPIVYARIRPSKGKFKFFRKTDVFFGEVITVDQLGVTDGKGDQYDNAAKSLMKLIYSLGE